IIMLDDALTSLARLDDRKARVVEMRYFGGLTVEEIAAALGVSTATVTREMRLAQAWLLREVGGKCKVKSGKWKVEKSSTSHFLLSTFYFPHSTFYFSHSTSFMTPER